METKEVSFVTKKALVSLVHPACVLLNGTAIFSHSFVCEYQVSDNNNSNELPRMFRVIGFPDGRKLKKSYILRLGNYSEVASLIEIDDSDLMQ